MKFSNTFIFLLILAVGFIFQSCNNQPLEEQKTNKYLFHAIPPEVNLEGSVLLLDGGITVLVQNGPLKVVPVILIPGNDSAKTKLRMLYDKKIEEEYGLLQKPWVKLSGNFIREDSLSSIFKYNWLEFLDSESELEQIEQMEE